MGSLEVQQHQADEFVVELPYPISSNRYWAVAKRGNRAITYVTAEAEAFKAEVYARCLQANMRRPIRGRVEVKVYLFPKRPQDWMKRAEKSRDWPDGVKCIDLDNALKVTIDALKGVAFEDDSWVRSIVAKRMEPDEFGARTVIVVRAMA